MTHTPTPHLQALRNTAESLAQLRQNPSQEALEMLVKQINRSAANFKSFKRIAAAYENSAFPEGADSAIVYLSGLMERELQQREILEARDIFTTAQAADYLDLSLQSVKQHYTYTGYLKGELVGKTRIFRKAELDEFMNNPEKRRRGPKELKPEKNRFKPKKGDQNDGQ